MSQQPVWKYLDNLGDQGDPIHHGGLFVYEDETGVYGHEMEKLEEPGNVPAADVFLAFEREARVLFKER